MHQISTIENSTTNDLIKEETIRETSTDMNNVFDHVREYVREHIASMKQGEKITVKDLTDTVFSQTNNIPHGHVFSLVQIFIKQCKDVTVEIGRGGGIYKGGKPKRVDNRLRCKECNQVLRHDLFHKPTITEVNN